MAEIHKAGNFHKIINNCSRICDKNKIIIFGIKPNQPDKNFGYIKKGKIYDKKSKTFYVDEFKDEIVGEVFHKVKNGSNC